MAIIYWTLGLISACYLLSSAFGLVDLDGDLDMDLDSDIEENPGPSVFSFRVLMGGIMGFCIGGAAMLYNGKEIGTQIWVGALVAIFFGVLAFYLAKFLYDLQGSSNFSMESVLGKTGRIVIQTSKSGTAAVKLVTSSGPREYTCVSKDKRIRFRTGDTVKVEEVMGNELIVSRV